MFSLKTLMLKNIDVFQTSPNTNFPLIILHSYHILHSRILVHVQSKLLYGLSMWTIWGRHRTCLQSQPPILTFGLQAILKMIGLQVCTSLNISFISATIFLSFKIKPSTPLRTLRMIHKPNASMCGWDCECALHHQHTVCIPVAMYRNLQIFCANTEGIKNAVCPVFAQVCT